MTAPSSHDVVKTEEQRHGTEVVPALPASRARKIAALAAAVSILYGVARGRHELTASTAAGLANASDAGAADAASGDAGSNANAAAPGRSAIGCRPVRVESVGSEGDRIHWWDASCHERTALVVPPTRPDVAGSGGGYVREFTFDRDGAHQVVRGTGANGWRGFGYVVAHYATNGANGASVDWADAETKDARIVGEQAVPLVGAHHLLYRFRWRLTPGGPVDVTVDWLFATGRDHPLYSITYDARPAGPGVVRADSRAPYGDMSFEGDASGAAGGAIGGVAWGDKYKFTTTSSGALSRGASWEYKDTNEVPFDRIWSAGTDAEMGLVGTARWSDKPQGGDYGDDAIERLWGTSGQGLPVDWAWPFQLNQYELPFTNASHRLAWGLSFGAVGQPAYNAFGRALAGYPFQSYAVHVVLGGHLDSEVMHAVADAEAEVDTVLDANRGKLDTEAPGGPGRTDLVTLSPPGWDSAYGVWSLEAGSGAVTLHIKIPAGRTLQSPMFRVHNWTAPTVKHVRFNRESLSSGELLSTVDAASKTLWLTLPRTLRGDMDVAIE